MDPERQWISRLEPATPADREDELDVALTRLIRRRRGTRFAES